MSVNPLDLLQPNPHHPNSRKRPSHRKGGRRDCVTAAPEAVLAPHSSAGRPTDG